MNTSRSARLARGARAPVFTGTDLFGNSVRLADYRGRWVLLSFFRNAACAICNLRVHEMIQRFPRYERAGLKILCVFESPDENLRRYVGRQEAPFPIIGDPLARLYDLYGLETSEEKVKEMLSVPLVQERAQAAAAAGFPLTPEQGSNFYRLHGDFLIDPEGILREAFYAELVGVHLGFDVIDSTLGLEPLGLSR